MESYKPILFNTLANRGIDYHFNKESGMLLISQSPHNSPELKVRSFFILYPHVIDFAFTIPTKLDRSQIRRANSILSELNDNLFFGKLEVSGKSTLSFSGEYKATSHEYHEAVEQMMELLCDYLVEYIPSVMIGCYKSITSDSLDTIPAV